MIRPFQETEISQTLMLLGFELERDFKFGYIRVWHKNMLMATFKTINDMFTHCFKDAGSFRMSLKSPNYVRLDAWKELVK